MPTKPTPASQPPSAPNTEAEKMLAMRADYDRQQGAARGLLMPQPAPARSDKDADHVKPWQDRVDPAYSVYKKFTAAQQEIAELRALLAAQSTHAGEAQAEIERLKAGWGEAFKLAVEWQGRAIRAEELQAERAPSGEAPASTFGDLAALLPGEFMWGDALQAATLCEILGAYDAQRATADNAAPTEADCHPTCGYIGADCNYPACKMSFASNAATAAPGDIPKLPELPWDESERCRDLHVTVKVGELSDAMHEYGRACIASNARAAPGCACQACNPHMVGRMMFICPTCGDKRCPHAADHRDACSAAPSNPPVGAAQEKTK